MSSSLYGIVSHLGLASAIPLLMTSFYSSFRVHLVDDVVPQHALADAEVFRPPIPVVATPEAALPDMRAVDREMFGFAEYPVGEEIVQDVVPGARYRIDLIKGKGSTAGTATLDLDRDGKWDERWSFEGAVTRMVSPDDNGAFIDTYAWSGRDWRVL